MVARRLDDLRPRPFHRGAITFALALRSPNLTRSPRLGSNSAIALIIWNMSFAANVVRSRLSSWVNLPFCEMNASDQPVTGDYVGDSSTVILFYQ
jgi:hypothetical protein